VKGKEKAGFWGEREMGFEKVEGIEIN